MKQLRSSFDPTTTWAEKLFCIPTWRDESLSFYYNSITWLTFNERKLRRWALAFHDDLHYYPRRSLTSYFNYTLMNIADDVILYSKIWQNADVSQPFMNSRSPSIIIPERKVSVWEDSISSHMVQQFSLFTFILFPELGAVQFFPHRLITQPETITRSSPPS